MSSHDQDRCWDGNDPPPGRKRKSESNLDPELFSYSMPKEFEAAFATAIFELGLKHSSPKLLIPLMPITELNTEHIKSHLQKHRIHHQRSKDEFSEFYSFFLRDEFRIWEGKQGSDGDARSSSGAIFTAPSSLLLTAAIAVPSLGDSTTEDSSPTTLLGGSNTSSELDLPQSKRPSNTSLARQSIAYIAEKVEVQAQVQEGVDSIDSAMGIVCQSKEVLSAWRQLCMEVIEHGDKMKDVLNISSKNIH